MRIILGRIFQVCRYLNLEVPSVINRSLGHYENCRLALNVLRDEAEQITVRRNGTLWTCYAWDKYITEHIFVNGGYHSAEIQAVLSWMEYHQRMVKGRNAIINVGANIGTTSIPFAQQTGCNVLAIEPIEENFKLLQRNIQQNGLNDRITCVQTAIDFHHGIIQMALPQSNCGGAVIKQAGTEPGFAESDNVRKKTEV
ncbi:MAG: FkbM family methyltransferase, partial [bacterium]